MKTISKIDNGDGAPLVPGHDPLVLSHRAANHDYMMVMKGKCHWIPEESREDEIVRLATEMDRLRTLLEVKRRRMAFAIRKERKRIKKMMRDQRNFCINKKINKD